MKRSILFLAAIILTATLVSEIGTGSSYAASKPPAPVGAKRLLPLGALKGSQSVELKLARKKGKAAKPTVRPKRGKRSDNGINLVITSDHNYTVHSGETNWFWSPGDGLYLYYQWWYSDEIGACLGPYEHRRYFYWTGTHWDFLVSWQFCGMTWRIVN